MPRFHGQSCLSQGNYVNQYKLEMSQGTDKNNEEGVIVKILEVASYSNLKQLQGNAVRDDK